MRLQIDATMPHTPNRLDEIREALRLSVVPSVEPDDWTKLDPPHVKRGLDIHAAVQFYSKVEEEVRTTLQDTLEVCAQKLRSSDWEHLASDRSKFAAELESVLRATRVCIQLLYEVRPNRPNANDERYHEVFMIKWASDEPKSKPLTFGQVAIKYNSRHESEEWITDKTAERAYKRLQERNQRVFGRMIALANLKRQLRHSTDPLLAEPPAPFSILAREPKAPLPPFVQAIKALYDKQAPSSEMLEKMTFAPYKWWEVFGDPADYDDPDQEDADLEANR